MKCDVLKIKLGFENVMFAKESGRAIAKNTVGLVEISIPIFISTSKF